LRFAHPEPVDARMVFRLTAPMQGRQETKDMAGGMAGQSLLGRAPSFMQRFTQDIRPGLFLVSATCGIIDATCVLALGGVFAEMMTGNLLLMAVNFGSGGKITHFDRFLWPLIAFAIGAILGGRLLRAANTAEENRIGFILVWLTIAASAVICWRYEPNGQETLGRAITALLAFGMGTQTALLRRHGVPDLATNVMTLTMTAVLAELPATGGKPKNSTRRISSIASFFCGGALGAFLVRYGTFASLTLASLLYTIALLPLFLGRKPAEETPLTATPLH